MRVFTALLAAYAAVVLLLAPSSTYATTCGSSLLPCRTLVASVTTIQNAPWSGTDTDHDYLSVTCYYLQANESANCAGGGDFDRITALATGCPSTATDNGATIILDKNNNCYFRKNFGLNGVVDARQCGVVGDGQPKGITMPGGEMHPDDEKVLNACMGLVTLAENPTLQNGLAVVSTGGGVILDNTDDIKIPANVTLTCGGTFNGGKNDYRIFEDVSGTPTPNLSHAIVIDPTNHGGSTPVYYSIRPTGNNAVFKDCTVVAGAGAPPDVGAQFPNPYSPSVFYPNCDPDPIIYDGTAPCLDDATTNLDPTRASTLMQHEFTAMPILPTGTGMTAGPAVNSVGIVATGGLNIENVGVVGFGTCITAQGPKPLMQNVDCDGGTGISIHTSDVPMIENTGVGANVTTGEAAFRIELLQWDPTTTPPSYRVNVDVVGTSGLPGFNYRFKDNDIVWITPQPGAGAESTSGYWVTSNTSCPSTMAPLCTFTLVGSQQSAVLSGATNTPGFPASVLTGLDPTNANFEYVQVGQTVSDTAGCTTGLTVTNVWPAKGIVYLSGPVACSGSGPHSFTFQDNTYSGSAGTCGITNPTGDSAPPPSPDTNGCAIVDPNFRWGDGIYVENSGGTRAVNCQVYEHLVSWHMYDGARSAFFTNCATGNANDLPDRNLGALISQTYPSGNLISVLIDGRHDSTDDDQPNETDACETDWSNMVLGQHRQTNIVVQSNCDASNRFANVALGGGASGIDLELDAGGVSLANGSGSSTSYVFKADTAMLYSYKDGMFTGHGPFDANLNISNNQLQTATLTMANADAAATTVGCGNTFQGAPTRYLCAPSSFTHAPGGRLTLCSTPPCAPVITADMNSAGQIYYVPYINQEIPVYDVTTGVFGLSQIPTIAPNYGLKLALNSTKHPADNLYDVYAETKTTDSSLELCTVPWLSKSGRAASAEPVQVNGIWVNRSDLHCDYDNTMADYRDCVPNTCTYLGTFYTTSDGVTKQQFGPRSANGGGNNVIGLWNAYNRVKAIAASVDSHGNWNATVASTWQALDAATGTGNRITVVDGLGVNAFNVSLTEANISSTSGGTFNVPQVGICIDLTTCTPSNPAQTGVTQRNSVPFSLSAYPQKGFHFVQAVQMAATILGTPFGTQATLALDWEY